MCWIITGWLFALFFLSFMLHMNMNISFFFSDFQLNLNKKQHLNKSLFYTGHETYAIFSLDKK